MTLEWAGDRRLRGWAVGLLPLLVVALVAGGLLISRGRDAGSGGRVAQERPGTVLLVAGYGGSTAALDALAGRLRQAGRTVRVVPPVGDNTGDLRDQARALGRVAASAIDAGAPSVDVVGYSAGGVVARIWTDEMDGAALTRRAVTLGSPHHGTDVAGLAAGVLPDACPAACRQLAPRSELLAGLPETPVGPRWTSIWTADDDLVLPPDSAVLPGAVDVQLQQVCADAQVRHGALPRDPLTIGLVLRALTGPSPAGPPDSADCAALRRAGADPTPG